MLASAALVLGCVSAAHQPASLISDPASAALYARLLRMADIRLADPALIDRVLSSPVPQLRAAGALAVGQLRLGAAAARLRVLLRDSDSTVAANAAFALGLLADSASVPALDSALRSTAVVAREAAWALGEIGAPARLAIEDALTGGVSLVVVGELLLAAAKLRPVPVAEVSRWLTSGDEGVVWRAAYAIARPQAPDGTRALLTFALHPSAAVRAQVARGLTRSATGDSLAAPAIARLDVLTADRHAHVRINALRAYATHGSTARLAVISGVRDSDANVRLAAAQSLDQVMNRDLARWAWLWDADTAWAYRQAVLAGAARVEVWLPALRVWADSSDWRMRAAVAQAAGAGGLARVREWALPLTRDPDPRVRAAAYRAIAPAADSTDRYSWGPQLLLPGLTDTDAFVRATVLTALTRRPSWVAVAELVESYRRALGDSVADARLAAVRAMAAAWSADSAAVPAAVAAEIRTLPPPPEESVRAAGAEISLLGAWAGVLGELRSLSWYQELVRSLILRPDTSPPLLATIQTERGPFVIELLSSDAPLTVHNFITLARSGYYQGTRFHRVVPNFVAQDGDPRGDGSGGPGSTIRDELNRNRFARGMVGMAHSGPDTGGSQYFITHSPQPHLDGRYTAFARVIEGMDVVDALVQGDRIEFVRVP